MPDTMQETRPASAAQTRAFDVVVVGGGLGGLYALYRLRGLGLTVQRVRGRVGRRRHLVLEPLSRRPVRRRKHGIFLSFSDESAAGVDWPERYGTQPEILRYINHVADRFDLRRDIQLNTRVVSAVYDPAAGRWTVGPTKATGVSRAILRHGERQSIDAAGCRTFTGLDRFKGKWYHTGLWPHEGVDFSGLRVGVIGTGSSGVQMIPQIAAQAEHLTVFQRTANFSLPARNAPLDPGKRARPQATL